MKEKKEKTRKKEEDKAYPDSANLACLKSSCFFLTVASPNVTNRALSASKGFPWYSPLYLISSKKLDKISIIQINK